MSYSFDLVSDTSEKQTFNLNTKIQNFGSGQLCLPLLFAFK